MNPTAEASLAGLDNAGLRALYRHTSGAFETLVKRGLSIDMARGKPSAEQLDESAALLTLPGACDTIAADGTDCRTYGGDPRGLAEIRNLLAPLVGAHPDRVVAAGNSSIALMHDTLVYCLLQGTPDSERPWSAESAIRFLCPVPGYDFHFNLLAGYGIEMINVPLLGDGPDMDAVEALAAADPTIKGLIGVPRYSNPTGETYGQATVERLAAMPTAAPDFRLFWDNAYAVHHLNSAPPELADILAACAAAGHANRALVYGSTSKITLPGAGVALMGASQANVAWFVDHARRRSIGPDKINQLRHARFLGDWAGLVRLMARHRSHLTARFDAVARVFEEILQPIGAAHWQKPAGGYFISLYTPPGCASAIVARAAHAGVTLTPAGAAFPYGKDPEDHHIRVAPTRLAPEQAACAARVLAHAVHLVVCEAALAARGIAADDPAAIEQSKTTR